MGREGGGGGASHHLHLLFCKNAYMMIDWPCIPVNIYMERPHGKMQCSEFIVCEHSLSGRFLGLDEICLISLDVLKFTCFCQSRNLN